MNCQEFMAMKHGGIEALTPSLLVAACKHTLSCAKCKRLLAEKGKTSSADQLAEIQSRASRNGCRSFEGDYD